MEVNVKLFASFAVGRLKNEIKVYPCQTTVAEVVESIGIDKRELGIILVNDKHASLDYVLENGDTLSLLPLVGGG